MTRMSSAIAMWERDKLQIIRKCDELTTHKSCVFVRIFDFEIERESPSANDFCTDKIVRNFLTGYVDPQKSINRSGDSIKLLTCT